MKFYTWEDWGAQPSLHRAGALMGMGIGTIVIHHTFQPRLDVGCTLDALLSAVRGMDNYHRTVNGWGAIGYNWMVDNSGRIVIGRGWNRSGAHAPGANGTSFGIAFIVDGSRDTLTPGAWEAAKEVIKEGRRVGKIAPGYRVLAHADFNKPACPGPNIYPLIKRLEETPTTAAVKKVAKDTPPVLRMGERNAYVRSLQNLLNMRPEHQTGYFGPITFQAVQDFQQARRIMVDGIVGPQTWAEVFKISK